MPLGNLIEEVRTLYVNSRQLITNVPEVHMPNAFRQALRTFLLQYCNGTVCKDNCFQVETSPQHWTFCSTQYLYLASIAHDCALVLKKYFDFLETRISVDHNMVSLVNDLQEELGERKKEFDNATDVMLREVDAKLRERNCTAYIAHCEENPDDQSSLCFFLAGFGVKNFKGNNGFRQMKDLFKGYILSVVPVQAESTGFWGHFVYYLTKDPDFYEQLTTIVNRNPMGALASSPLQLILFGAPGTGKSFKIDDVENGYGLKDIDEEFKFRTTFHPDYDYAQFVGAYKPLKTNAIPILNEDELLRELRVFQAEERPNPVHKFAARYYNSLKRLTTEEKRALFNGAEVPDSVQNTEVPKAISIAGFLDRENKPSSITYSFVPQVFAKAYVKAWIEYLKASTRNPAVEWENVYLVIEEINRGNCAQIFGDIFQLLDRKEGHSDYPIDVDSDFASYIEEQLSNVKQSDGTITNYWNDYKNKIQEWDGSEQGEERADDDFCKIALPPNLNILATMNTSDQSLFPMDSAFKRRFDWEYVPIKYAKDSDCGENWNANKFEIEIGESKYKWLDFLEKVNADIYEATRSEDKQMGEFFIKPKDGKTILFKDFRSKVFFYLWDSVYKDETERKLVFHFEYGEGANKIDEVTFQSLFGKNSKEIVCKIMENLKVEKVTD